MTIPNLMIVATLVLDHNDIRSTHAYVKTPEDITWLKIHGRLNGSRISGYESTDCIVLRLSLEEIAVGITHNFLKLILPTITREQDEIGRNLNMLKLFEQRVKEYLTHPILQQQPTTLTSSHVFHLAPMMALRLFVFDDLWKRGYYVAFGSKFGVDYLVYDDDPSTCHATTMILVKDWNTPFECIDLASFCRVAAMVKKQLVFASVKQVEMEDNNSVFKVVYLNVSHALLVSRQQS